MNMSSAKLILKYSIVALVSSFILGGCHSVMQNVMPQTQTPSTTKRADVTPQPTKGPVKVVLLLPLSGASKDLGRSMLDAAQLALFNANMPNLQLIPIDTESSPAAATNAARSAIAQGAKIVVGPVFSKTTSAVAPILRAQNINLLSFSNNKDLRGANVYLIGFMLDQQIKRVSRFALTQNLTDFYVLAPANAYGKMAVESLTESLMNSEGAIIKAEFYPEQVGEAFGLSVKSIGDALKNAMHEPGKAERSVLLIPEGGDRLGHVTSLLAQSGVDLKRIKVIGSGQWDDESTKKMPLLTGGWFAGSAPEQHDIFEHQFMEQFGYKPVRIATLSYDAVALIAALLGQQQDLSAASLTNTQGFMGVDGIFRLRKDGLSERGLAVLQITENGFVVADPAPSVFEAK